MNSAGAKLAVAKGIANTTGVPAPYVDVDLTVDPLRRRLRASSVSQGSVVAVTYVVSVGADAPVSVTAMGEDVSSKLDATNSGAIGDAISASVDESLGAGSFVLALQDVNVAEVVVQGVTSQSSTSRLPFASSTTSLSATSTVTSHSSTTHSSSTEATSSTSYAAATTTVEIMSGARSKTSPALVFAMCTVFVFSSVRR